MGQQPSGVFGKVDQNIFPAKFENIYTRKTDNAFHKKAQNEKLLTGHNGNKIDRRKKVKDQIDDRLIVLIRMIFDGTPYVGTGTIISNESILTCAHNFVDVDPTDKHNYKFADNAWFDMIDCKRNKLIKRIKIKKFCIYPKYFDNPSSHSGYDIAIGKFEDDDILNACQKLLGKDWQFPYLGDGYRAFCNANLRDCNIYGYPGEKKVNYGECMQMI